MVVRQVVEPLAERLPIFIVGAGGIVRDAHLPAYRKAGFHIAGICDLAREKAACLQKDFPEIGAVYDSLEAFLGRNRGEQVVFDVAVPANEITAILEKLPDGAVVLLQKPMGETLAEAQVIFRICERKSLTAAVNFQLKYAPFSVAAKDMVINDIIGNVFDVEIMVCVYTPWHLWRFLENKRRVEILYHSIHYLDLIRSLLGNPKRIYASTLKHPSTPQLASARSTMILDYDDYTQARIITNHGHAYDLQEQRSYLKIEGTKGAIKAQIGVSLDYPRGTADSFSFVSEETGRQWMQLKLLGNWFPDAFIGPMTEIQRLFLRNEGDRLRILRDNYETMKLVELAYRSSESGGTGFNEIM